MIALWDDTKFQVSSIEYGYGGLVCTVSICKVVLSVLLLVFMPLVLC